MIEKTQFQSLKHIEIIKKLQMKNSQEKNKIRLTKNPKIIQQWIHHRKSILLLNQLSIILKYHPKEKSITIKFLR